LRGGAGVAQDCTPCTRGRPRSAVAEQHQIPRSLPGESPVPGEGVEEARQVLLLIKTSRRQEIALRQAQLGSAAGGISSGMSRATGEMLVIQDGKALENSFVGHAEKLEVAAVLLGADDACLKVADQPRLTNSIHHLRRLSWRLESLTTKFGVCVLKLQAKAACAQFSPQDWMTRTSGLIASSVAVKRAAISQPGRVSQSHSGKTVTQRKASLAGSFSHAYVWSRPDISTAVTWTNRAAARSRA